MANEIVKIVMLRGEKGEIGYPTDVQLLAQIQRYIQENPDVTIDVQTITNATQAWMDEHGVPTVISDSQTSTSTTWSSSKIESMIAAQELDDYYRKAEVDLKLSDKQNSITFGTDEPTGGNDGDIYIQY